MLSGLAGILFYDQYGRYFFGIFSLLPSFPRVFTMFLFLLVTREILDFVCFQILQAYYLMIQSFDAVLLNGMQTRWLAPDHFFYSCTSPAESSWRTMEPFWPYARSKENRRRAKDHCSCASTRTEHFWSWQGSSGEPTVAFWFKVMRSLRKRHTRSMICVPPLVLIRRPVKPPLCEASLT